MVQGNKKLNIALQGGGSHGALAWGILDRILEDGRIDFDSISATSAGAMNAIILAHGLACGGRECARKALAHFWKTISDEGLKYSPLRLTPLEELMGVKIENSLSYYFFDLLSRSFSPYELNPLNFNPLRDILESQVDFDKVRTCSFFKIFISATNVQTGKIKVFDNKELCIDSVMASACLPFMFQAVEVKNEYYWDGGYMGNPAIFPLIYNSDCGDILIIHINPIYRESVPNTANTILNRINEISFNSSLMREMRAIGFVTKMLDNGWIKDEFKKNLKRIFMHSIRADLTMQSFSVASKLNPEWSFIHQLYELGRNEAEKWLKQHYGSIGKKTTIDFDEYL